MDLNRNNLDRAASLYLRQHADNPVHWQEWSDEALQFAKENDLLILVSVGYSTCHWCHVMAGEAFSDETVADYLNDNFVAIKIDREQRPDIDQYMMGWTVRRQGQGGWPLNVFLTPDLKPILAVTYLPTTPSRGMPSFLDVLRDVKRYYDEHPDGFDEYKPPAPETPSVNEEQLLKIIHANYDGVYGGYGIGKKFPHYNTILFLAHWYDYSGTAIAGDLVAHHLDTMAFRGLHDHLQGGFFRYCVDRAWTVPHFEKMLYDQAMMLWAYSVGYKVFEKPEYRMVIEKLIRCLRETFEEDGLFYSAHDADTDHVEGATYVWTREELRDVLNPAEFEEFTDVYDIREKGNFEGKNHLIRTKDRFLLEIEDKLLDVRNKRPQPFTDRKIVTSWNALTAMGMLMAYRYAGIEEGLTRAAETFDMLRERHLIDGRLCHSSLDGEVQRDEFLEDYAAMALLSTFLQEETGNYGDEMREHVENLDNFRDGEWWEAKNEDFVPVAAEDYDQPYPSSVSVAEYSILRRDILLDREYKPLTYKPPISHDFANIVRMAANGRFHLLHSPELLKWENLPLNSVQIRSQNVQDCYDASCRDYDTVGDMLESIRSDGE